MAVDRIHLGVGHLSRQFETNNPDAVHSVGLSHLEDYLKVMYGEDIPRDVVARRLSGALLGSMAVLSTDEDVARLLHTDALAYIPHWLRVLEPVVDDAKAIGKYVDAELTAREAQGRAAEQPMTNDFTYMLALFDLSSFVIVNQLELDHPRFQATNLMERSKAVMPVGQVLVDRFSPKDSAAMDRITQMPFIKAAYRRKIVNLRRQGAKIATNTELFLQRTRLLVAHDADEQET